MSPWPIRPKFPSLRPPPHRSNFKLVLVCRFETKRAYYESAHQILQVSRIVDRILLPPSSYLGAGTIAQVGYHCSLSPCRRAPREKGGKGGEPRGRERRRTLWRLTPSTTRQPSLTLALDSLSLVSSATGPLHLSHPSPGPTPAPYPRLLSLLTSESGPWSSSAESTLFASNPLPPPAPPPPPSRNPRQRFQ